jgi:hypothetical protein
MSAPQAWIHEHRACAARLVEAPGFSPAISGHYAPGFSPGDTGTWAKARHILFFFAGLKPGASTRGRLWRN